MKKDCTELCKELEVSCPCEKCRYWINYEDDLNCSIISARKGPLTLREAGDRIGVTWVRIKQIQDAALEKLGKKME